MDGSLCRKKFHTSSWTSGIKSAYPKHFARKAWSVWHRYLTLSIRERSIFAVGFFWFQCSHHRRASLGSAIDFNQSLRPCRVLQNLEQVQVQPCAHPLPDALHLRCWRCSLE